MFSTNSMNKKTNRSALQTIVVNGSDLANQDLQIKVTIDDEGAKVVDNVTFTGNVGISRQYILKSGADNTGVIIIGTGGIDISKSDDIIAPTVEFVTDDVRSAIKAQNGHLDIVKVLINANELNYKSHITFQTGTVTELIKSTTNIKPINNNNKTLLNLIIKHSSSISHLEKINLIIRHLNNNKISSIITMDQFDSLINMLAHSHEEMMRKNGINYEKLLTKLVLLINKIMKLHYKIDDIIPIFPIFIKITTFGGISETKNKEIYQGDNKGLEKVMVDNFKKIIGDKIYRSFFAAVNEGNVRKVEKFINLGVNIDLFSNITDEDSVYYSKINNGFCRHVNRCFWDFNPMFEFHSRTALSIALINGHSELSIRLIELGANVNHPDRNQDYPIHHAAYKIKNIEVILKLIKEGACIDFINSDNKTALDIASLYSNSNIALQLAEFTTNKISEETYKSLFNIALMDGDSKLLELIFKKSHINPEFNNHTAIKKAIKNGHVSSTFLLLRYYLQNGGIEELEKKIIVKNETFHKAQLAMDFFTQPNSLLYLSGIKIADNPDIFTSELLKKSNLPEIMIKPIKTYRNQKL